jgi:glycosyltransferase involved in cell wall biosynthesis
MSDRLRILHAIRSDRFAGVEQFVRRLAVRQAEDGHAVAVLGGAAEHMRRPLTAAGVAWESATTNAALFRAARRHLSTSDVVNTHMTAADLAVLAARAASASTAPIVATRHFAQPRGSVGPRSSYRLIERRIDAEIAISAAVAERIGVPSTVVHPGVDPSAPTDPARRRRSVLVAQRLQREKYTDVAVRAFAASGLADDGWVLEIAGTGPEASALQELASQLGIPTAVRLLGFRTDLPLLMSEAGMLMASSPFEHFGLTVLEAMSAGLPVVAADAAGHAEMLGGLDARALFAPGDVDGAAESLRSLAGDAAGRVALGDQERARQRERFTLAAQAAGTEAVYRTVIREARHE